jgi:GWxTD domain-containing protein
MGESTVLVDQIAVNQLPTGTYVLDVSLIDTGQVVLSRSAKKFFVYNATLGVDTSLVTRAPHNLGNLYAGMSEEELDREFAWARYETNDAERAQYERLSGFQSKSTYLLDLWGRRPLGLRDEYLHRVAFANLNYHVLGRDGYKTDRGRVHIIYGTPDDVERHPNEPESKPYEIWSYHSIQGGVIFVFVQRIEGGEYELVHSTHRNELHDELWSVHYAQTAR